MGALGTLGANLGVYLGAFALTLLVVVYGLRVPHLLTGAPDLTDVYYRERWATNVPLDLLFVTLYYAAALGAAAALGVGPRQVAARTVVIAAVTAALTGGFVWYFVRSPVDPASFFSRWFHRVGWRGAAYDVVLLVVMYLVYRRGCALLGVEAVL